MGVRNEAKAPTVRCMETPSRLSRLFRRELWSLSARHSEVWRQYEILYHVNDFVAGLLFVVGSVLFFWESTQRTATWMFLVGSILFTLRPGIRLMRDLRLTRLPDDDRSTGVA